MAEPFKKQMVRYFDADGKRCTPDTLGAVKHVELSKKYYGLVPQPNGKRKAVPLTPDLDKSKRMLNKLLSDAALESVGLVDPFRDQKKKPLADHLNDWQNDLTAKGATEKHASLTAERARRIVADCKFRWTTDLNASRVQRAVADLRNGRLSVQTCNFYLQAIKQFARWLVRDRRMGDNPLAHLERGNVKTDRRHDRRDLSRDELAALFAAARTGEAIRDISGPDRAMLYAVAVFTGLRASELASLTRSSFHLDDDTPIVTVEAAYSKRRRADTLPLHPDLVRDLRPWLAGKPAEERLWPGKWAEQFYGAKFMRADLARARAAWIAEAGDDAGERQRRESSSFLAYEDDAGRFVDFHSLRHTFVSEVVRSGATPKVAQTLARHSTITLTIDRYAHTGLFDTAAAVEALPSIPSTAPSTPEKTAAKATGTDGFGCTLVAQTPCNQGHSQTLRVHNEEGDSRVNEEGVTSSQPLPVSCVGISSHSQSERRERDLNPRTGYPVGGFQDRCNRPLCHPSDAGVQSRR
jgi:integrase